MPWGSPAGRAELSGEPDRALFAVKGTGGGCPCGLCAAAVVEGCRCCPSEGNSPAVEK